MKKILYLAMVIMLPTSLLVADSGGHRIEGYWFSTHSNHEIRIKSKLYGLKVKGLPGSRNSWKRLRNTGQHNVFRDSRGNVLIRDSHNRIVYKRRSRNGWSHWEDRVYHFSRDMDCNSSPYYQDYNDYGRYRDRRGDYGYCRGGDYYREDRDRNQGRSASAIRKTLSGKWKTRGLDKNRRVEIRSVQTGINARFKNKDRWIFYAQDRVDPNVFTDRKGNRYILKRDLSLKWIGISGKEFILEKY